MASSIQEIEGIGRSLGRLEMRIKDYRKVLVAMSYGSAPADVDMETVAITNGEVETTEALIRDFAIRVSGGEPNIHLWELLHPHCSKNEAENIGWAE